MSSGEHGWMFGDSVKQTPVSLRDTVNVTVCVYIYSVLYVVYIGLHVCDYVSV